MMTQPTTKAQSAFDWLCYVLVLFGGLCLLASLPQTFTMVRVAHDEFGSAILVVVLEVMAFFALLAPLWVPAWTKTFDRIAYTLLGITTLGNYAGGWNYVWTHSEMGPFWTGIRDWREPIFSLPLATILLVGTLSGLVPFAMKFFISLAIKRYRENELDRSPDAVAQRAIEPVLVQIIATQRLQERLLGLTNQFNNQPLVLPNVQPTRNASVALRDLGIDVGAEMERILSERAAQRQEGEQRHPFEAEGLPVEDQREVWQAIRAAQDEPHARWEEPGLYGGYTEKEMNCKGCFGPCGMCETDTQATTEAHTCDGKPLEDFCPDCYARWENAESGRGPAVGAPEPAQAVAEASDKPEIGGAQFLLGLAAALFTPPPDDGEPEDENDWEQNWEEDAEQPNDHLKQAAARYSLDELLAEAGYTREDILYTLKAYRVKSAQEAYSGLRLLGKLPRGMTLEQFTPLYDELVAPADVSANEAQTDAGMPADANPTQEAGDAAEARTEAPVSAAGAPVTWTCTGCGADGTNGQKGVARKWSTARKLGDALYCADCRNARS